MSHRPAHPHDPPTERIVDGVLAAGTIGLGIVGGVAPFLSAVLTVVSSLIADRRLGRVRDERRSTGNSLDERSGQAGDTVVLRGATLLLAALLLEMEMAKLWDCPEAAEATERLRVSPEEYADAAEELEGLGLVVIDPDANQVHGIARARLTETAVLQLGPALVRHLDWKDYVARILFALEHDHEPERTFLTSRLQTLTRIPTPRLALLLRALVALGLVDGSGPGSHEYGEFMSVELTSAGRRVLRDAAMSLD